MNKLPYPPITLAYYQDRLLSLIRSGTDFPKKEIDRQILLLSIALQFSASQIYTEKQTNSTIQGWLLQFGYYTRIDHITLRVTTYMPIKYHKKIKKLVK